MILARLLIVETREYDYKECGSHEIIKSWNEKRKGSKMLSIYD